MPILFYHENTSLRQRVTYNSAGQKVREENFYPNEQAMNTIGFVNELEEGEVKTYSENGKLLEIRNYNKGRLNGKREVYDESGKLLASEIWENGNKIEK